MQTRPLPNRY